MTNNNLLIIIVVLGIIGLIYFMNQGEEQKVVDATQESFIDVNGYFDAKGNPLSKIRAFSVIGGVEGVKYITLKIIVNNLDSVPLTLKIKNFTPGEIIQAIPSVSITVPPGNTGSWITGLIDVEPYEGKTQDFCVTVESDIIPARRKSSHVGGCVGVKVDPNPFGNFQISINNSIDPIPAINPACTESWSCTVWGSCINSIQTRTCTDANSCGTTLTKPVESQSCIAPVSIVKFRTTNTAYTSGAVAYASTCGGALTAYGYASTSTTTCTLNGFTIVGATKEGYTICTRSSSPTNLYIQIGAGHKVYDSTDPDASLVSTSTSSINVANEVTC